MNDIFNPLFWKKRIDTATKEHYSVYVTNDTDWKQIDATHKKLLAHNVEGKVLDAGCGYGRMASFFEPHEYTGVDFSPDFIERAKQKYPDHTFVQADLRTLPFTDQEFDWAFCVSIRRMVVRDAGQDAWEAMAQELRRVAQHTLILEYEDPDNIEILW